MSIVLVHVLRNAVQVVAKNVKAIARLTVIYHVKGNAVKNVGEDVKALAMVALVFVQENVELIVIPSVKLVVKMAAITLVVLHVWVNLTIMT